MTITDFAKIIYKMGGKAYFVGGCVRDYIMKRQSHDHDILIVGISKKPLKTTFQKLLLRVKFSLFIVFV